MPRTQGFIEDLIPAHGEAAVNLNLKGGYGRKPKGSMRRSSYRTRRASRPRVPTTKQYWGNGVAANSVANFVTPIAPTQVINRVCTFTTSQVSSAGLPIKTQVLRTSGSVSLSNAGEHAVVVWLYCYLEPLDDDGAPFAASDVDITDADFLNRRGILWRKQVILQPEGVAGSIRRFSMSMKGGQLWPDRQLSLFMLLRGIGNAAAEAVDLVHDIASNCTA